MQNFERVLAIIALSDSLLQCPMNGNALKLILKLCKHLNTFWFWRQSNQPFFMGNSQGNRASDLMHRNGTVKSFMVDHFMYTFYQIRSLP